MHFKDVFVTFQVSCSTGTYIRTLGYDIASCLGTVGFVKELTRTAIGDYQLKDSINIDTFENNWINLR
jgi:tRNA pseudouridine55 synthase